MTEFQEGSKVARVEVDDSALIQEALVESVTLKHRFLWVPVARRPGVIQSVHDEMDCELCRLCALASRAVTLEAVPEAASAYPLMRNRLDSARRIGVDPDGHQPDGFAWSQAYRQDVSILLATIDSLDAALSSEDATRPTGNKE